MPGQWRKVLTELPSIPRWSLSRQTRRESGGANVPGPPANPSRTGSRPATLLTLPPLLRTQLPSEYPFKPPEVYMLTPSGRFEINKKICLSISSFHP